MKLEKLTKEQELKMIEVRDRYLDYIFSCKNQLDRKTIGEKINWLYSLAKLDAPITICVDSPMGCQYANHLLKSMLKVKLDSVWASVENSVWASVRDSVRDSVEASVWDSVRDSVWNSVEASVRDSVRDSVWNSVRDSVWASVRASVLASVWDSVEASVWDSVWASVRDSVRDSVEASVWDSVRDSVWNSVEASVWDSVGDSVSASVSASVWASVSASVRDSVWDSVWASVEASVGASVEAKIAFEQFSSYGNIGNYGWASFYQYFTEIGILKNENFNKFNDLILSGIYDMIQLDKFCIVSDMPIFISRNQEGRLHNLSDSAIKFKDGYEQHYIQGVFITPELFNKLSSNQYKFDDFIKESNEEIKSACLFYIREKFGEDYVYGLLSSHLKEVNTYTHKKDKSLLIGTTGGMNIGVYTLFEGDFGELKIAYVRCYCPSTDRMFYLGVEPIYNNAKDAIASLYKVPNKLKPHIKEIRRQGERFSTTFTSDGLSILNSITKEDAENLVSISGNEYFEKMSYEF